MERDPPWVDDVLSFWFGELGREAWFRKSEVMDAVIRDRFARVHDRAASEPVEAALTSPRRARSRHVLDQFSRNMFRGTPRAFASDAKAREIARGRRARYPLLRHPRPQLPLHAVRAQRGSGRPGAGGRAHRRARGRRVHALCPRASRYHPRGSGGFRIATACLAGSRRPRRRSRAARSRRASLPETGSRHDDERAFLDFLARRARGPRPRRRAAHVRRRGISCDGVMFAWWPTIPSQGRCREPGCVRGRGPRAMPLRGPGQAGRDVLLAGPRAAARQSDQDLAWARTALAVADREGDSRHGVRSGRWPPGRAMSRRLLSALRSSAASRAHAAQHRLAVRRRAGMEPLAHGSRGMAFARRSGGCPGLAAVIRGHRPGPCDQGLRARPSLTRDAASRGGRASTACIEAGRLPVGQLRRLSSIGSGDSL